ncbi:hypothetical protein NLG97_g4695 [Lecanicillium saksenae]|uniref:Uncharacterized protein n=1 Tax=Lecanicillium saksenae TaxID=468837 RepID=A0ACC1QVR8_9HYPO|nr:hypothetical protein NLG97_g4695 [Lecanicillium saksenae]
MDNRGINTQKTLVTPMWVLGIRIAQVVLSVVILGMAATWSTYSLFDGPSIAIAAAVFTWLIVAYSVVTEKIPAANAFYTVYAVIILDAYMCIIWLSTWALNAARRAAFGSLDGIDGNVGGHGQYCYNGICYDYKKRSIEARSITYKTLYGLLAGVAALGAFVWISFIVTLAWTIMNFLKGRKDGRFTFGSSRTVTAEHTMEEQKPQGQPQQYAQPQYAGQEQQAYPQYPQQTPQVGAQYAHDPNQITPHQQ